MPWDSLKELPNPAASRREMTPLSTDTQAPAASFQQLHQNFKRFSSPSISTQAAASSPVNPHVYRKPTVWNGNPVTGQ